MHYIQLKLKVYALFNPCFWRSMSAPKVFELHSRTFFKFFAGLTLFRSAWVLKFARCRTNGDGFKWFLRIEIVNTFPAALSRNSRHLRPLSQLCHYLSSGFHGEESSWQPILSGRLKLLVYFFLNRKFRKSRVGERVRAAAIPIFIDINGRVFSVHGFRY